MKTENYERRESWSFISDFSTSIVRLALAGGQSENVKERKGKSARKAVRIAEIRAITSDDNNYEPVFMVDRHATEILLSAVVLSLLLLFPFSFSPSEKRHGNRDLVKNHSPRGEPSRVALNLASLMTESQRCADRENRPCRRFWSLIIHFSRWNVAKNMPAHAG